MDVKVRFYTNYPKTSDKKWRIIIKETQYLVDEIKINCPSFTSEDTVTGDNGEPIVKYHVSIDAKSVEFEYKENYIKAIVI